MPSSSPPSRQRRRRSQTPPPPTSRVRSPSKDSKNESFNDSKTNQQEETSTVPNVSHDSSKRRNRWGNNENANERQTVAQDTNLKDELPLISQPNPAPVESNDIPQQLEEPIVTNTTANVSKSKWDDDEEEMTTDSLQQNQTQPEP